MLTIRDHIVPIRDQVINLATIDGEALADSFMRDASWVWDKKAESRWTHVSLDLCLDSGERKSLKGVYLVALVDSCRRIADAYYAANAKGGA